MAQRKPRPYGNGRYTEAGFWNFVRSGLRQKYNKWGPKYDVLKEARQASRAKRYKWKYRCAICQELHPNKNVQVDHIVPCGSLRSFSDLPGFVKRLFCEKEGLRVLCKQCHNKVTQEQRKNAASNN